MARRGFNIVLHGRTASKLDKCIQQLKSKFPNRKFDVAIADASLTGDAAIKQIQGLLAKLPPNITVLINNVGAGLGDRTFSRFVDRSLPELCDIMAVNEGFPTLLTHALLPRLIKCQPALIMNIGSALDDWSAAYVEPYCGAKAHNKSFNQALRTELALEGIDIELLHIRVMAVATPSSQEKPSAMTVTPHAMARGALNRVGSGVASTAGCLRHEIIYWVFESLMSKQAISTMTSGMVKHKIVPDSKPRQ